MDYDAPVVIDNNFSITEDKMVWFIVLVVVLLTLATTVIAACIIFCELRGKCFAGHWSYTNHGGAVRFGCK
jgi:hypothetical protein